MAKQNSMASNPGAQGHCSFGTSFKQETSNITSTSLPMSQTIANPGKGPVAKSGGGKGPAMVKFGPAKVPQPAKNRAGFTTSD
jgi:hypothetical protein